MTSENRVYIVGMGDDGAEGLTSAARQVVSEAELLIGPLACLEAVETEAERIPIGGNVESIIGQIEEHRARRIAVLASGDPLFYGTARFLCERLGKDRFEVLPHVSSMQLAFARVKESWDEAYLTNLATRGIDRVVERIRTAEKVGLFTTEDSPPSAVCQALLDRRIDYFIAYVCEDLGAPNERVTQGELSEIAATEFGPLNVLILVRKPQSPDWPIAMAGKRLFGNPDEMFLQSQPKRGLLTPAEVRAIALAEMNLGAMSVVWDIGAGSGAVAIEAAMIAPQGHAYAIEMDAEDHQLIESNSLRFGVGNLTAVLGQAPDAWANLPKPNAVFVGGAGRQVGHIVELAVQSLQAGGTLVANVMSLENVVAVREVLRPLPGKDDVWMVNVARGAHQLERLTLESLNPSFLIAYRAD